MYRCAKRTQKMQASASCKVSSGYRKLWKPFFVSPEVQRTAFCCGDKQNIQKIHSHLWEVFLGMATANFSYTIFSQFFSHSSAAFSPFAEFIFKFEIVCQNNKNVFRLSCVCSFHHSAVVKYFSVAFCFLSLPVAAGQKQECGQKIFFSDLH